MKWHKSMEPDPALPWPQRFWQKVDQSGECWVWLASRNHAGYGQWAMGKCEVGEQLAHRVAWTVTNGPVPEGLTLDHLCRNPACVNPDHLEPVTQRVNIQRGVNVGRPRSSHCREGHPLSGSNLYTKPNGERQCRICKRRAWVLRNRSPSKRTGPRGLLTECKRGHPYDDANTYFDPAGRRHCRGCRAFNQRMARSRSGS